MDKLRVWTKHFQYYYINIMQLYSYNRNNWRKVPNINNERSVIGKFFVIQLYRIAIKQTNN